MQFDYFMKDNYTLRHMTGHNMLDPESLLTGEEIARGFTYDNSRRDYLRESAYLSVISGEVPTDLIPYIAPRVLNSKNGEKQ